MFKTPLVETEHHVLQFCCHIKKRVKEVMHFVLFYSCSHCFAQFCSSHLVQWFNLKLNLNHHLLSCSNLWKCLWLANHHIICNLKKKVVWIKKKNACTLYFFSQYHSETTKVACNDFQSASRSSNISSGKRRCSESYCNPFRRLTEHP